jgi:predicted permease
MLDTLLNDFRYALRALAARPGFTIAAVLTLALGIGANATIFSVVDALLLRPLPYPHGERLVALENASPKTGELHGNSTVPDYLDQRSQATSLADAALYQYASFNLATDGPPLRLKGVRATASLFSTLGSVALRGRVFGDDEAVEGRDRVAVLSYTAWQKRFDADPAIVGRDLRLGGEAYRVIGVMPPGFFFPDRDVELWAPYSIRAAQRSDDERGHSDVESIGLLQAGATIASLDTELRAITARNAARSSELREDYAQTGFTMLATPLNEAWFGPLGSMLWLLQGMVALVLLITGANVANLVLVRFNARQGDFAVRAALGADRVRLARQVLVETSLLALLGGGTGLLLAAALVPLLEHLGLAQAWGSSVAIGTGAHTIAFVLGLSLATGVLLGLVTLATLRRAQGFELLRASGRGNTRGGGRMRDAMVVAQLALTLMLLVTSGLLLKSFDRLQKTDPGFVSAGRITARLNLSSADYDGDAAAARYYERLLTAVRALPGIDKAAYTSSLPFDGHLGTSGFVAEGYAGDDARHLSAERQSVDEDYFATLDLRLLEGRAFSASDTQGSTPVVIVDETLARHLWPERSALGQRLRLQDDNSPWMTVVGVARSVRQNDLAEQPSLDSMYWPYRQHPVRFGELVVKSAAPAATVVPALRAAALNADAQLPLYDIRTLDERIARSLDQRRTPLLLLGAFAALALALAAIGTYGVLAFAMAQRTRELGVRMAIGADTRDVLRLVVGSGMRLAAVGIAAGALGALALGQALRAQLYEVGAADPAVFVCMAGVLALVALIACWLPARRAARTAPLEALRHE